MTNPVPMTTKAISAFLSSRQAAAMLGLPVHALQRAVWSGRVEAPQKSPAGDFLWTLEDLGHASWILCHCPLQLSQDSGGERAVAEQTG